MYCWVFICSQCAFVCEPARVHVLAYTCVHQHMFVYVSACVCMPGYCVCA